MKLSGILFSILICCCQNMHAQTFTDMENIHKHLSNASRHIKPRLNQTFPVNIDISVFLVGIQDYNEIGGTLIFTASFVFHWKDETKVWAPEEFGGINATKVRVFQAWIPTLILRNGVTGNNLYQYENSVQAENAEVTYNFSGDTTFQIFGQYDVTCDSDASYYPSDEHTCSIIVMTTDLLHDLTLTSDFGINLDTSLSNSEWMIKSDTSETRKSTLTVKSFDNIYIQDQIEFKFILSRQFYFPLLNIVLPIILLSLVNLMVFLLPVESGERTSISFTLLLTFVVFMTMVSERLPAGNKISLFNLFLINQLFASILVTLFLVLGIRLFYNDLNDKKLNIFYRIILTFYKFSIRDVRCKNRIEIQAGDETCGQKSTTTSKLCAFYDRLCLWIFGIGYGSSLIVYGLIFHFRYTNRS